MNERLGVLHALEGSWPSLEPVVKIMCRPNGFLHRHSETVARNNT